MGYAGYFLIVWDFIAFAKRNGIPVGPGRGSGAGSVAAYSLRITDIDPLAYNLLFERFLNPERVSMPDFDVDFCQKRRGEVIQYVSEHYGPNNVGQIITFGQLKARACIRDVSRVLNFPYTEADRLAKLIPETLGITLDQAYAEEPRLREAIQSDARLQRLYELCRTLEGTNRNAGMHAAGIVISDTPLWDTVPVTRGAAGEIVTQFAKDEVEQAGLVKFDFLGLRNLTIADAVRDQRAARRHEAAVDIDHIRLDDEKVYRLISTGDTAGIFQLESSGFQELMRKLRPNCFEDIVAAGALYRPGPLSSGMVDDFVDCKHGHKQAVYPHPWVEPILRETYGVIVYQEQVMQIAQVLAGYTLGGADLLRRAMGKKKAEEMAAQKAIFMDGAAAKGVDPKVAENIFDKMALFAGYGFNKSHSAAYAMVTYQTAYLKTHHPVHFMAALMTNDADRTERVVRLIHEAKAMGIRVLPPGVNDSRLHFTVREGAIRFGLAAIKGVGHSAIEAIMAGRSEGRFKSLFDFCERVDLHRVNRRVIETLVKSGAFDALSPQPLPVADLDALGAWRATLFAAVGSAFDLGQKAQADRDVGQGSLDLFGGANGTAQVAGAHYPKAEPWSDKVLLEAEKECLGFYVSGHPLERYEKELTRYVTHDTRGLERAGDRVEVHIGGMVDSIRERRTKRGDGRHAFAMLEDRYGQVEILVFNRVFAECEDVLKSGQPVLVMGTVRVEGDEENPERKVVADKVQLLTEAREARITKVVVTLHAALSTDQAARLRGILQSHPGNAPPGWRCAWSLPGMPFALPDQYAVRPTDELVNDVERLLGRGSVSLA
jgi:DNA polymerase-3 subunit alpha